MAMKAGRVGVAPDQVDKRGKVTGAGLTPEQQAKLDRALLTPVQAPVEDKIVGVSTGRDQLMLGIGAGLAIEDNQLIGTEVPEYTASEAGKVLKVNAEGELEWADPPAGGGYIDMITEGTLVSNLHVYGGTFASESGYNTYYIPVTPGNTYFMGAGEASSGNTVYFDTAEVVPAAGVRAGEFAQTYDRHFGYQLTIPEGKNYLAMIIKASDATKIHGYVIPL